MRFLTPRDTFAMVLDLNYTEANQYVPPDSVRNISLATWARRVPIALTNPLETIDLEEVMQRYDMFLNPDGTTFIRAATDKVPLFDEGMYRFPLIMRPLEAKRNVEQPQFLNPFNETWGYTPEQQEQFCSTRTTDCESHRGCVSVSGKCSMASVPDCSAPHTPERPCSHPSYPVCVEIVALADEGEKGVSLNAAGTLWLQKNNDNQTQCVPITRKVRADPYNYKSLYAQGVLRKPNCGFAVDAGACGEYPSSFMGPLDSVFTDSNLADQSVWFSYGSAYRDAAPNSDATSTPVWTATGVINATTAADIGDQVGDYGRFTTIFDNNVCANPAIPDLSGCGGDFDDTNFNFA